MQARKNSLPRVLTAGLMMLSLFSGNIVHAKKAMSENEKWAAIKTFGFQDMDELLTVACHQNPENFVNCVNALASIFSGEDDYITTAAEIQDYRIKVRKTLFQAGSLLFVEREGNATMPARIANLKGKQRQQALIADHKRALREAMQSSAHRLKDLAVFIRAKAMKAGEPEAKLAAQFVSAYFQNEDAYFSLSLAEDFSESTKGEAEDYTIYGISLDYNLEKAAIIQNLTEGSAAMKAGLRQGDRIISIDGVSTDGKSPEEVRAMFASKKSATFDVRRNGNKITIPVSKSLVSIENVTSKVVQSQGRKYLSIQLGSFMDSNGCKKISDAIQFGERARLDGIILDLRSNGGGQLTQAVCVASLFLPQNSVVTYVKYLNGQPTEALSTIDDSMMSQLQLRRTNLPLAVLVDSLSASASEVLTGALRDYKRAWIIGDRTYGKGTVMTVTPLPKAPEINLTETMAVFHQPDGTTNQIVGIVPDFKVNSRPGMPDSAELSIRNEDRETGAIISAENKVVQSKRVREMAKINPCLDHRRITQEFNSKYGTAEQPDYRLMFAEEVLRCSN